MKNNRHTTNLVLVAATAFAVTTTFTKAAEISTSTTAPTIDGDDIANYAAPTATQKWFDDIEHDAGQTFTPSADGLVQSFTIFLSSPNPNDAGNENVDLRFGTISRPDGEFTFTDVYSENAAMAPSPDGDWAENDYVTFTFDTPQEVSAGVEYGIITDAQSMGTWQDGIPYRHRSGNDYDGGVLINRGGESGGSDLIFHIDIAPAGEADPFEITEASYEQEALPSPTVTLTWTNTGAETYVVKYSHDLVTWVGDLDDGVTPDQDENPADPDHITVTFSLGGGLEDDPDLFFRVEQ